MWVENDDHPAGCSEMLLHLMAWISIIFVTWGKSGQTDTQEKP